MAHEARTDFSMFLCLFFLLNAGAGFLSTERKLNHCNNDDGSDCYGMEM
jgi:hypothetical protein